MKKIVGLIAFILCANFTHATGILYVSNTSCTDVNFAIYVANNSCSTLVDQTNSTGTILLAPANTGTQYDFNQMPDGPYSAIATPTWVSGSGLNTPPGPWDILQMDIWNACTTWPVGGVGCGYPHDGLTVYNPNCTSGPSSGTFILDNSNPCGSCHVCPNPPCVLPNCATAIDLINVTFTTNAGDWYLTIY